MCTIYNRSLMSTLCKHYATIVRLIKKKSCQTIHLILLFCLWFFGNIDLFDKHKHLLLAPQSLYATICSITFCRPR